MQNKYNRVFKCDAQTKYCPKKLAFSVFLLFFNFYIQNELRDQVQNFDSQNLTKQQIESKFYIYIADVKSTCKTKPILRYL